LGVFNDNTGQTGFTIVNLNNGKSIRRFAFSGDKSTEFDLNSISINGAIGNASAFTVLQANPPCKVFLYKWQSLLNVQNYKPEPIYYPQNYGYSNSFLLNDSTIFGQFSYSKFDDKLFGVTNIKSKRLITDIDVPRIDDASLKHYYEDPQYYKLLKGLLSNRVAYRPGSKYEFASFSQMGAVIQIFKVDTNYKFTVKREKAFYLPPFTIVEGPGFFKPKMAPGRKYGFNDIAVTGDKIFALFNGPKLTELHTFTDVLLVYNWDGKAIQSFKLDRKCRNIAIDESNPHILYGLYGERDVRIVKYKLP
jgi:hypothetical protein